MTDGKPLNEVAGAPVLGSIPSSARWCQPGDMQDSRHYLVSFDDPDRQNAVFTDWGQARDFYLRATVSWNCWLFAAVPADEVRGEAAETAAEPQDTARGARGSCSFDVIVSVPPGDPFGENDERLKALYEAGCDDATVSSQGEGSLRIAFGREGDLSVAVGFALSEISEALPECRFSRIEFSDKG